MFDLFFFFELFFSLVLFLTFFSSFLSHYCFIIFTEVPKGVVKLWFEQKMEEKDFDLDLGEEEGLTPQQKRKKKRQTHNLSKDVS